MSDVEYLDVSDVLGIARITLGTVSTVRDYDPLESAVDRPRASVFGEDVYTDVCTKTAALPHSLAGNYALADGNKRTAWAAAMVFLDINGHPLRIALDEDRAEGLMVREVRGLVGIGEIADALDGFTE
ncbi:death-on-curing protein [Actinopolyspora erythraea]|uniref:Death-on-curing protein n=1 Tax=Actinopolyspora erythraea TaxID=414996 RepID=A0A099D5N8_9ACTN|nr:Fic family protein [Actinopolyspora erythraea]ASU78998.1 death-on-curing protein [Actinopolyspora erythraea]KGI81127.1 death-on-curing protein [Actinopolyspora erythraea]